VAPGGPADPVRIVDWGPAALRPRVAPGLLWAGGQTGSPGLAAKSSTQGWAKRVTDVTR
jgi:hypothetical protein